MHVLPARLTLACGRLWQSRLGYVAILLLPLMQRLPVVKVASIARVITAPMPRVLSWATPTTVTFVGSHAVTGATTEVFPLNDSFANPVETAVGEEFVWAFRTAKNKAKSYSFSGLPEGIEHSGRIDRISVSSISGVPTEAGQFTVEIVGWRGDKLDRQSTPPYRLTIIVTDDGQGTLPSIVSGPAGGTFLRGEEVMLTVEAEGEELSFQWEKDGEPLDGETAATLTLAAFAAADAGDYAVVVSNGAGSVKSVPATLVDGGDPQGNAPEIVAGPLGGSHLIGDSVVLTVDASGDDLTYQWRKDGEPIDGATGPELVLDPFAAGDAGDYLVVIANSGGEVESEVARLEVGGRSYADWRDAFFPSEPGNISLAGLPGADPDGDGLPNAGEFYAGLDPTRADGFPRIESAVDEAGLRTVLTLPRDPGAVGFRVHLERSSDLQPENWLAVEPDGPGVEWIEGAEELRVSLPVEASPGGFRWGFSEEVSEK